MAKKLQKVTLQVEIELNDNLENEYPNYRYNFCNRGEFVKMIRNEIENIIMPQYGAKVNCHSLK